MGAARRVVLPREHERSVRPAAPAGAAALEDGEDVVAHLVIAVVDGDWACQDLFGDVLTSAGHHPVLWDVRTDAFDLIARLRPDLVILDTWLRARDDGWQLLQAWGGRQ